MPRSPLAYLNDIVASCDGIAVTLDGVDLDAYECNLREECAALIQELGSARY